MKRLLGWIVRGVVASIVLGGLIGGWLWWQLQTPPSWYDLEDARATPSAEAAEQLEYTMAEAFHQIRPDDASRWTIRLGEREINGWLANRLPDWLAHRSESWPNELGTPQVRVRPEGIDIAMTARLGSQERHVMGQLIPRFTEDGVTFDVTRIGLGRLAVSRERATTIASTLSEALPALADAEGALSTTSFGTSFELSDDRVVRVVDLECGDGFIVLTNETTAP